MEEELNVKDPVAPGIYHIHIDAVEFPLPLQRYARETLGFMDTDFSGQPPGYKHFSAPQHKTFKTFDRKMFDKTWNNLEIKSEELGLKGYLEGEYIPYDINVPYKPYTEIPMPFKIERRRLVGPPKEEFREVEFHLTMDKDRSDPHLVKNILESGLYGAYMPKRWGTAVILTMQGFYREIVPLAHVFKNYLEQAGGAVRGTLKEEIVMKYHLFGITHEQLPEIAGKIEYR